MQYLFIFLTLFGVSSKLDNDISHSSVSIQVRMSDRTEWGTGTVIACEDKNSLIITNAHVVENANHPIFVTYWYEGESYIQEATYLGGSKVRQIASDLIDVDGPDLALLSLNCKLNPVKLAKKIPEDNTKIKIYGFGSANNSLNPVLKFGRTIPIENWAGKVQRININSVNGDSGSGIFNENNELVAVLWGGAAVRLDIIKSFTKKILQDQNKFPLFIFHLNEGN